MAGSRARTTTSQTDPYRQGWAPLWVPTGTTTAALKIKTVATPKRWVGTAEVVTQSGTSVLSCGHETGELSATLAV